MRILKKTGYDNNLYTDENTLYRSGLLTPVQLTTSLTYLGGKDTNLFPILSATQGLGKIVSKKPKKLNDTEYTWPIMGRIKLTSRLVRVETTGSRIGLHGSVVLVFDDATFIHQYAIISPTGKQLRLESDGKRVSGGFAYTARMHSANSYLEAADLVKGKAWGLNAPSVAASKSIGNRSNRVTPGELTNQFGFMRFSQNIAGNVANKVVEFEFEVEGGAKTNKWMPLEMYQFELQKNIMSEQDLWLSEYNRDEYGVITLIDEETGEPIPKGAGIRQTLKDMGYYDQYAYLSTKYFDEILNMISDNDNNLKTGAITVYGGAGARREFHQMMERESVSKNFTYKLSDTMISEVPTGLSYGKYFSQYRDINGRVINFVETDLFNRGAIAEQQKQNGDVIDGLPIVSYTMAFLNIGSNTNGEDNITLVAEEGREVIRNIYAGMSPLPDEWGALGKSNLISNVRDISSYEVMESKGINILDATTCFYLEKAA